MTEQVQVLEKTVAAHDPLQPDLSPDLRTLVRIGVDSTDYWSAHLLHLTGTGTEKHVTLPQPLAQRSGGPTSSSAAWPTRP